MRTKSSAFLTFVMISLIFLTNAQAAPIAPRSGAAMCNALTVADFKSVGIMNASPPKANIQEDGVSAYCTYAGKSSATGGIELDVFYGMDLTDAKATEETAIEDVRSALKPIQIAGTDNAQWSPNAVAGGPPFATIVVRRGGLVFSLGIPSSPNAQAQLLKLTEIILKRF